MKTAWIFPGGSARSVYTAGVVYALSEMKIPKPDIIIGCSGSVPTSLCFLAEQRDVLKSGWCDSLEPGKFLSFWRFWKMLDVDYMVYDILRDKLGLNIKAAKESPVTAYFPLTDSKTGEIEYVSNRQNIDLFKVARAAVSVPFWTNLFSTKGVFINGKFYSDCAPAARFHLHVKKAMEEDAKRVIVFDNWCQEDNPTGYFFSKFFIYLKNNNFKKRQLSYFKEIENFSPPSNVDFILFKPKVKLGMSRWNDSLSNAKNIFQRGYSETLNNDKLKEIYEPRSN